MSTSPYVPNPARIAAIKANTHKLPEGYTCQQPVCPVHARGAVLAANAWATRLLVPVIAEAVGR